MMFIPIDPVRVHRLVILKLEAYTGSCHPVVWDHQDYRMEPFLCDFD